MTHVLIIGAKGRLGSRLHDNLAKNPAYTVQGVDVDELDITEFHDVRSYIGYYAPHVVINCAAWTDVDGCAKDPQKALQINGYGAGNIALTCAEIGAEMVQISTNEVFDGTQTTPYREYDPTRPINPYAYSKWAGERAIIHNCPRHYIVRTAWLFAHGGKNFIHSILTAVNAGKPLRVVTDEIANPTYNDDLAEALPRLFETHRYGIYHLVNSGIASRYDFARYVLDKTGNTNIPITPITFKDWERASTPPAYAALENTNGAFLGITMRHWHDAVDDFLQKEGLLR